MAIIMTHMAYTHRIDLKLRESIMPLAMFVNTNSKLAVDVGSLIEMFYSFVLRSDKTLLRYCDKLLRHLKGSQTQPETQGASHLVENFGSRSGAHCLFLTWNMAI